MKIIYVHQLFKTPEEGGGIRSFYLAKALVDAGHEVHMIASHNSKNGLENVDGILVHYQKVNYDNSYGFIKRLWAYGRFVLMARKEAKRIGNADLAYVMTTPLTTGWIATWIKSKLGIPYYFEVGDLWPDVPIEMGVIKANWMKRWLYKKEREFYDLATKVIAMSPPQVENIRSKTKTPVELIPNMADTEFYIPAFREEEVSAEKPLKILYSGAHGRANQLEFLVEAAREVQDLPIHFTFMGEGSEKERIMNLAESLTIVSFIDHGNKEEVREQLQKHDAVHLSFQNIEILHTGCPNKFFDAMAAGKVVFSNLGSWTADLIRENEIGFAYSPIDPNSFKEQVQSFLKKDTIRKAQERSLALSETYSRKILSAQFLTCLQNH